jgi:hypothetical protein
MYSLCVAYGTSPDGQWAGNTMVPVKTSRVQRELRFGLFWLKARIFSLHGYKNWEYGKKTAG